MLIEAFILNGYESLAHVVGNLVHADGETVGVGTDVLVDLVALSVIDDGSFADCHDRRIVGVEERMPRKTPIPAATPQMPMPTTAASMTLTQVRAIFLPHFCDLELSVFCFARTPFLP